MLLLAEFATETIFQLRLRSNSNPMRASDFRQSLDGLEWSRMSSWKNVYVQWICKKRGQLFAILSLLRSNFHEEPYRNVVLLYLNFYVALPTAFISETLTNGLWWVVFEWLVERSFVSVSDISAEEGTT